MLRDFETCLNDYRNSNDYFQKQQLFSEAKTIAGNSFEQRYQLYSEHLSFYQDFYDDPGDDPDDVLLGQYCDNLRNEEIPEILKLAENIRQCVILYLCTLNNKRHFSLRKSIIEKAAELTKDSPKSILQLLPYIKETLFNNDEKEEKMNEELRQQIKAFADVTAK